MLKIFTHCLLVTALLSLDSLAHGIDIECAVEAGELVVTAHMDDDEVAAGNTVEIRGAGGAILRSGTVDDHGVFRWQPERIQDVAITVTAGPAHRGSLRIDAEQLRALFEGKAVPPGLGHPNSDTELPNAPAVYPTERALNQATRVLVGLTFCLALAAGWMSYRNTKRLTHLERQLRQRESGN